MSPSLWLVHFLLSQQRASQLGPSGDNFTVMEFQLRHFLKKIFLTIQPACLRHPDFNLSFYIILLGHSKY